MRDTGAEPARLDAGSAVADFALVGALVTVLFLSVVQLGVVLYVHNMLVSCAAEGARAGARADSQPSDASEAARTLIRRTVGQRYARSVDSDEETSGGVQVVVVHVRAPFPLFGLVGASHAMTATGRAFKERQ